MLFRSEQEAEPRPAQSAEDMAEVRDIVPYRKHGNELPAKVEHEDEQQRQRQFAPARPGEGGQDDDCLLYTSRCV